MVRHLEPLKADRQRVRNRQENQPQAAAIQQATEAQLTLLDEQIAALEQHVQEHIAQHEALKTQQALLTTLPAIGDICAATFLAEVPDVSRFAQASQLAAFAGLTPGRRQSGTSLNQAGPLVKWGNTRLRRVLFMPALSAHNRNPIIASLRKRLEQRGKRKMTIIVAVMRKLLHLCYGVLKRGQPFDSDYLKQPQTT